MKWPTIYIGNFTPEGRGGGVRRLEAVLKIGSKKPTIEFLLHEVGGEMSPIEELMVETARKFFSEDQGEG